jgi:hypothetical protein
MIKYNQYNIKDNDRFEAHLFPKVSDELDQIFKATASVPFNKKEYIMLCFLKTHSLKNEWITDNPELTTLFTNGHFKTSNIDALYESGRHHSKFIESFEDYIKRSIS